MSLRNDPRWVALAKAAAKVMGSSDPDIIAAILAQWTCEHGNDPYPPVRNNPGNLARGAAQGLGYPFSVQYPNPQPGNPIVTFDTPMHGAQAYGKLIATGSRYAAVRVAVAAGNGHAYVIAMGQSGYGTSIICMVNAYVPTAPPTDTIPPKPKTEATDMAILLQDEAQPLVVEVPAGGEWFYDSERKQPGAKFGPVEVPYVGFVPSGPSRAVVVTTKLVNPNGQPTIVYVSSGYTVKAK